MALTVELYFTADAAWSDISGYVNRDSLQIFQTVANSKFQTTRDTAKFTTVYDTTLAGKMFAATDRVKVRIKDGTTFLFSGAIRPFTQLNIQNGLGSIDWECIDNSELLNEAVGAQILKTSVKVLDGADTANSAVHLLLSGTGLSVAAGAPTISTVLPYFVVDATDNRRDALEELLYYNGYTCDYDAEGNISAFSWVRDTVTSAYTFDDSSAYNILDGSLNVSKIEESAEDSVEVNYRAISNITNAIVYSRNVGKDLSSVANFQNFNSNFFNLTDLKYISLSNYRISGEYFLARTFLGIKWIDGDNIPFQFTAVGQTQYNFAGYGPRLATFTVNDDYSFSIRFEHNNYDGGLLNTSIWPRVNQFKVIADAVVEASQAVAKSEGATATYQKITAKYLYDADKAKDFAEAYRLNVLANPYVFSLASYEDRPLGEIVEIDSTIGNVNSVGVIIEKSYNNQTLEYAYKVRALSAITPSSGEPAQTPPVPLPVETPPVIVPPLIPGQTSPAYLLGQEVPSEFNQGIIVRAGGVEHLRISYGLKTDSTAPLYSLDGATTASGFSAMGAGTLWTVASGALSKRVFSGGSSSVTAYAQWDFGSGNEDYTAKNVWYDKINEEFILVLFRAADNRFYIEGTVSGLLGYFYEAALVTYSVASCVYQFGKYYAATDNGLYSSTDGATWAQITFQPDDDVVLYPSGNTLFIFADREIYVMDSSENITSVHTTASDMGATYGYPIVEDETEIAVSIIGTSPNYTLVKLNSSTYDVIEEEYDPAVYCGLSFTAGFYVGYKYNSGTSKWDFGAFGSLSYGSDFTTIYADISNGGSFTNFQNEEARIYSMENNYASFGYIGEPIFTALYYLGAGAPYNLYVRQFNALDYTITIPTSETATNFREKRIILSNNTTDANNDIDFAAGQVYASDDASKLVGTAKTKRLDAAWSAGTGNGGLDTGSKANSTWYACYIIGKTDGTTDYLFSTSASSPTLPTGYTLYRRIGWARTDGSGNLLGFTQTGNWFEYKVIQTPKTFSASASTARQTIDVIAPPATKARVIFVFSSGTGNTQGWAMSTNFTDVAATGNAFTMLNPTAGGITSVPHEIVTDSSSLIAWRQAHAWSLAIDTVGWTDLDL